MLRKSFLGAGKFLILALLLPVTSVVMAQDGEPSAEERFLQRGQITGNFQIDAQYYNEDTLIGAQEVPEQVLSNGFANVLYTNGKITAGLRYESYQNVMLGFPTSYKGSGIPYRFVQFKSDNLDVTAGNFYEQFGSGIVFRTYEERGLGYDNAMDGFRAIYKPHKSLQFKALIGKQRLYFTQGEGIVRAFDGEWSVNDAVESLSEAKTRVTIGGSFVSKYQPDQSSVYVLPENVGAYAGRVNITRGNYTLMAEYAHKENDPSSDNEFIYKDGEALVIQGSYSKKGFGVSLSAKRIDNMSFRSDRSASITDLQMNFIPAFNRQHTYLLLATLYPYATQPLGEMSIQGELVYKVPKKSKLGGKYGMGILLNYSLVHDIERNSLDDMATNRVSYSSPFFQVGEERYFQEINGEITKKFSKKFKGILTYSYLEYNMDVLQGKEGKNLIESHVVVADMTYKLKKKQALRMELQHMYNGQDLGDWATGVLEWSYSPHWYVAVIDQYNYGNKDEDQRLHYYYFSAGYTNKANRIMLSYGRQRAGIFCVGGVCRNVPASNGFALSITSSF